MDTSRAMEWLLENENDPSIDDPVDQKIIDFYQLKASGVKSTEFMADPVV
jgi:hypothetical protein